MPLIATEEKRNFAVKFVITMWFFIFFILPLAGVGYALWHVYTLLAMIPWLRGVVIGLCIALIGLMAVTFSEQLDRLPMPVARVTYQVSNSFLFVLLYVVMAFLVLDVGRLVGLVPRSWLYANGYTAIALTAVLTAVFVYGNIQYNNKVRARITLTTAKPLERPLRIVMLSDLHLGYHNGRHKLARWIDLINAEHPDLVLIGGDIIDISVRPLIYEGMAQEFHRLQAPVYACLGNHEYYSGDSRAQQFYHDAGITLLRDSVAQVMGLRIVGRDDRSNPHRRALGALLRDSTDTNRPNPYTILLDHQPYHLEQAQRAGVDFQFSGHTHYGQVWPVSWITRLLYEDAFGPWQRGQTRYYVSSGMGIWGAKFRIGTRSEYVVADLKHE